MAVDERRLLYSAGVVTLPGEGCKSQKEKWKKTSKSLTVPELTCREGDWSRIGGLYNLFTACEGDDRAPSGD